MIMECQARGPAGRDRSYFRLLLVRFDDTAAVDPGCDLTPVRLIDPEGITITGDGGETNITAALELTLGRLQLYLQTLEMHPEKAEHPLPLVVLFSDGEHNHGPPPLPAAEDIRNLFFQGDTVTIAAAGVSVAGSQPDEALLREIASPGCYVPVASAAALTRFISSVGSSGASRASDIAALLGRLQV